jgi:hypothetical protein
MGRMPTPLILALRASTFFLPGFEFIQQGIEALEVALPNPAVAL